MSHGKRKQGRGNVSVTIFGNYSGPGCDYVTDRKMLKAQTPKIFAFVRNPGSAVNSAEVWNYSLLANDSRPHERLSRAPSSLRVQI